MQAAPPQTSPTSSVRRRVAAVVAVSAGSVAFILLWGLDRNFFDLKIYMRAMDWWAAGNPLYDYVQPDRVQGELYFTYPPLSALLLRPFGALPLGATIAIFTVLTVAAIALTTWWLIKPVAERRDLPLWYAAGLAIPLALLVEPSRETISFGQINMLLVVLILADLLFAVPRNSRWAGVGIGLATALKLFPGIFIVYLLVTRRWRAAAVSAATAAGATLLAAAIFPGDSWRFWTVELWSTERVGRPDYTGNQSLQGMLARLVAPDQPPKVVWLLVAVAVAGVRAVAGRPRRTGRRQRGRADADRARRRADQPDHLAAPRLLVHPGVDRADRRRRAAQLLALRDHAGRDDLRSQHVHRLGRGRRPHPRPGHVPAPQPVCAAHAGPFVVATGTTRTRTCAKWTDLVS